MGIRKLYAAFFALCGMTAFSQVAITEIYYDTPYSEFSDRGQSYGPHHLGEYIELYNYTTEDLPLKGWYITDNASKYVFPDNAVIASESFLLVAYRDFYWPESGNYFTNFFPTTQGKEAQILYQGQMMMRNRHEGVNLHMGFVRGTDLRGHTIHSTHWYNDGFDANMDPNYYTNPSLVNYYLSSIHLGSNGNFYPSVATPLTSDYVPPTQDLEDIASFQQASQDNYSGLTWETYSNAILAITCPLVIPVVEQGVPWTDTILEKCFNYDQSGNNVSVSSCDESDESEEPGIVPGSQYDNSEMEEIASSIILYPNPTSSVVNVQWNASINGKIVQIQSFSNSGVNFSTLPVMPFQSSAVVNLSYQPTGIYILIFVLDTGQSISKNVMKI